MHAIILAGGAARRLGADKPEQRVGARRLLDVALAAVAGAESIVVVGPNRNVPPGVVVVQEAPPRSGPVAAISAGLRVVPADPTDVVVLPADLPWIDAAAVTALAAARGNAPVAVAVDEHGRPQYLTAVWDGAALRTALTADARRVKDLIPPGAVLATVGDVTDIDTPDQLANARARAGLTRGSGSE